MEYYSVIKKNKIMAFVGKWMQLENIMPIEISQSQKHKQMMIPTCLLIVGKYVTSFFLKIWAEIFIQKVF